MYTGACIMGYASEGCKEIRQQIEKQFDAMLTVINNIYQPCYHQKIPYLPKILQGRKTIKSFETCEDLLGIYHFFNKPLMA